MPLSDAFNPNKPPNIKDVQYTPEKKSEKIFDPERDITAEDWREMLKKLNESRGGDWFIFYSRASDLLTLFPERRAELHLDDEAFEGMLKNLRHAPPSQSEKWSSFASRAHMLLNVFPERREELRLGDLEFRGILDIINKHRQDENWGWFSLRANHFLTLFPDRSIELHLGEPEFQGMLSALNIFREHRDWENFSARASRLLTLFTERRAELNLDDEAFQVMLKQLNKYRGRDWDAFFDRAPELKILLADEIKHKEDGTLDIIFNKPQPTELKEETPPLPTMRNY